MISCQLCKIFKNTFFIEHLRWLLFAILKPLDSQRQLHKLNQNIKLATIYFISTFNILLTFSCLFLSSTSFPFTSRRPFGWGNMAVLIFHVTIQLKCHVTFWVGHHHPGSAPYQVLGVVYLVNGETKRFDLTRDHVTDVSRDFAGEVLSSQVTTQPSLGSIDLVKAEI